VNVREETNEEMPKFTISFEDDLAMLQANESNKSQQNQKQRIAL